MPIRRQEGLAIMRNDSVICESCGNEIDVEDAVIPRDGSGWHCESCTSECGYCGDGFVDIYESHLWRSCVRCDDSVCPESGYEHCDDCDGYTCENCPSCDCGRGDVRPWNFKPDEFNFYGDGITFGVELEVQGYVHEIVRTVHRYDDDESHLWIMEDGSVDGAEIVTHPMSLSFIRSYPFGEMLRELRAAGCETVNGTGIHVHVGRDAFRRDGVHSQTHVYRWLKFIYENRAQSELIAGRRCSRWARFEDFGTGGSDSLRRKSACYATCDDRYVAVNTTNHSTFEVRIFRSTFDLAQFHACVEYVAASIEYARGRFGGSGIGDGLRWSSFVSWLTENENTYPALASVVRLRGVA